MPNFKKGPVPSPGYGEDANQFSQITEFSNDVYVYGKLYANIEASDVFGDDKVELNDVEVKKNFFVSGFSTFIGPVDMDYLTVKQRLDVGVGGTVFTAISTTNGYNGEGQTGGRVGIGSTQPDGRFQVAVGGETLDPREPVDLFQSAFLITDDGSIGIGTTIPVQKIQIKTGDNDSTNSGVVITGFGTVGLGTTNPSNFTNDGTIKLDVQGSVSIQEELYDSRNSKGNPGNFLSKDGDGITWVSFEPNFQEGISLMDEDIYVPTPAQGGTPGTGQLFTILNFKQLNSLGDGTDTLIPTARDPSTITGIATIFTQDLWGYQGGGGAGAAIYRMTRVGINENSPSYQLDVNGTLHASNDVTFDLNLDVGSDTTIGGTLDVAGQSDFTDSTDSTTTTDGAVVVAGGVGIGKKLNVGDDVKIDGTTTSTDKDTGALVVDGGVGIEENINIGGYGVIAGRLDVDDATESTTTTDGAVVIDGGLGLGKNINVGGSGVIAGTLDVDDTTESVDITTGAVVVDGGLGVAKNVNIGSNAKVGGNLELEAQIKDFFDNTGVGICKTDYRLSSFDTAGVGVGVSWRPSGVQTKRTLYVTKNGCDTNSGLLEGDAKFTIGAAAAIAQEGDTIKVRSGIYSENNPIGLRTDVAITGEDLRLVTVVPQNTNKDVFHVRRGCLIENLSFAGATILTDHPNCGGVAFPPTQASVNAGTDFQAVTGYTLLGPANQGAAGRWRSPYIRNCTNFMTGSIGMKINGDHANAAYSGENDLGQDLKSMVCDSYTQYNEAGIGVSITNNGYAQLVSIFTIGCDVGIAVASGGQCDLTNSNSSFGNIGLQADGFGDIEFTGQLKEGIDAQSDTIISQFTQDISNSARVPFDGQGVYFHLDMSDYDDTTSSATVTEPLEVIRALRVVNGGNPGDYLPTSPPLITVVDANNNDDPTPLGPEAILPEFSPNVSAAGTITSVDIINSGRNFLPNQNLVVQISSGSATFAIDMDPILFTVSEATETTPIDPSNPSISGITTVTFNEFIPYPVKATAPIKYVRLSRIITSSHSFEYIGAGTDINTSNPFQGGRPIPENEVIAINGGQVPFTSTDQKGNFRIGDGLTIDQTTSTIRGRDFNRAIQAQLTPLILALR